MKISHLHSNHSASRRTHDLRHFYASALIRSGLNVKAVQSRLGHATASETLDVYGRLFPDDADFGRSAIETVFGDDERRAAR